MISPAIAIVQLNGITYRELKSIEISQSINSHHHFSISLGSEKIGEVANAFLEKARDFVGTDMAIEIQNREQGKLIFRGIITKVRSTATSLSELGHTVVIEGYSPSILLDNGQHCQVYADKSLKEIADEICRDYPVNLLRPDISPMNKESIPYTIQYQETPFNFLNRLACRHGEWFYFDGQSMVFGNKKQKTIELLYGTNLLSFDIGLSVSPLVQSFSSRIYKEDNLQTQGISGQKSSMKGMASFAMDQSSKTFLGKPVNIVHQFDDDSAIGKQMDDAARLTIQGEAARKVTFTGVSIDPALYPGAIISVNNLTGRGKAKQGEYIITTVNHTWESGGHYRNSFSAIPSDAEVPPMTNPMLVPICQSQSAVVTDNIDPDGLGRVKVRFSWQKYGDSPWIRIAMPYGGANKGVYFVPEKGEEVMVGFEGGNAEKPYVQGTLYHSKASPGSLNNGNNDTKAIKTRSGHTIEFNDNESNGWGISIKDKVGNRINIDSKGKNIEIIALETMTLSAKNMIVNVDEQITINAATKEETIQQTSVLNITQDYTISSGNCKQTVNGEKEETIQSSYKLVASDASIKSSSGDIKVQSSGSAVFQGAGEVKVSQG